jgi:hypothetical protein
MCQVYCYVIVRLVSPIILKGWLLCSYMAPLRLFWRKTKVILLSSSNVFFLSEIVTKAVTFLQNNQERYPNYDKMPNFKFMFLVGADSIPLHYLNITLTLKYVFTLHSTMNIQSCTAQHNAPIHCCPPQDS